MTNNWKDSIAMPSRNNLARVGLKDFDQLLESGASIKQVISDNILKYFNNFSSLRILDFGCGCGRLYLPLYFETDAEVHGSDIDDTAIDYLKCVTKNDHLGVNNFNPPLNYPDEHFNVLTSISIWTHLTPEHGIEWLKEVKRVLKPGGIALLSTAGFGTLNWRRKNSHNHWLKQWENVSDDELREQGTIYKEYAGLHKNTDLYNGVSGSYGLTTNDPEQIKRDWGEFFSSVEVIESCISNQDLVVVQK